MSYNERIEKKLNELCTITSSKRIYRKEYEKSGIPFYRSKEVIQKHNNEPIDLELFISKERYHEIKTQFGVPEKGDILLTSVGTLGIPYYIDNEDEFYFKDGNLTWFKLFSNEIHSKYLYYYILSPIGKEKIDQITIGSTQKAITIQGLKNVKIKIPTKNEQVLITKILSSLDDTIELNNKINNNLEELAQTLYKHWFVDFEFPNEEGLPYKSSGGKMVESELGLIPEGWIIEPLGNSKISKLITSGINKFKNEKIYLATADVTNTTITNRNTTITMEDKPSRANMQPRENTLWFAKMKNSRKLIRVSRNSTELINDYIFSTGFAGLYVENYLNFVWTFLLTPSFNEIKDTLASGTTQEAINNRNINKINLLIPKEKTLNKFEKILNSVYGKIEQNDNENRRLEKLRDLLLPKLMSGEIRVPIKE